MFDIPSGYSCVVRYNDTTLYAYRNNTRDTYTLNGFDWQKTGTNSSSSLPNNSVCVKDYQIPSQTFGAIILSACVIVIVFFAVLYKAIMGVFHSFLR